MLTRLPVQHQGSFVLPSAKWMFIVSCVGPDQAIRQVIRRGLGMPTQLFEGTWKVIYQTTLLSYQLPHTCIASVEILRVSLCPCEGVVTVTPFSQRAGTLSRTHEGESSFWGVSSTWTNRFSNLYPDGDFLEQL